MLRQVIGQGPAQCRARAPVPLSRVKRFVIGVERKPSSATSMATASPISRAVTVTAPSPWPEALSSSMSRICPTTRPGTFAMAIS